MISKSPSSYPTVYAFVEYLINTVHVYTLTSVRNLYRVKTRQFLSTTHNEYTDLSVDCGLAMVTGQNILQLVVQTGTEVEDSGCDCAIGVSITNTDLLSCDISELESAGDDFESSVAIGYEVLSVNYPN